MSRVDVTGRQLPPLEHLLDGVDALVCGLDAAGRILHINRRCEEISGLTRDTALGQGWLEVFAPAPRHEEVRALWSDTRAGRRVGPFEALCRRERSVRWQFSPWTSAPTGEEGICAFGIDVTRDREALARALDAERSVAIAHLSAGLAHEIRNPLNSAKLQLDLAERNVAAARYDRIAEAVRHAADEIIRASSLLDDFLAFARPRELRLERIDLRRLVARVQQSAQADAPAGVRIGVEQGPPLIVEPDEALVALAIGHLLANAIDATAGWVAIRLQLEGNAVCIAVEDDGPGLPDPETPIFDAFFTTKPQSTGLGLAIVQRVAFDHGGTISYRRDGGRTSFVLRLPVVFGGGLLSLPA